MVGGGQGWPARPGVGPVQSGANLSMLTPCAGPIAPNATVAVCFVHGFPQEILHSAFAGALRQLQKGLQLHRGEPAGAHQRLSAPPTYVDLSPVLSDRARPRTTSLVPMIHANDRVCACCAELTRPRGSSASSRSRGVSQRWRAVAKQ